MDRSRYLSLFFAEAEQGLQELDARLLELEGQDREAALASAFRAAHNLKGMSATVGFDGVATRAHALEDRLDALRGGAAMDAGTVDALLADVDGLRAAVDAAMTTAPATVEAASERASVTCQVQAPAGADRVVRVMFRPDTPLRGVRATLALRRALDAVELLGHEPASLDEDFDGDLLLYPSADTDDAALEAAVRSAGDVDTVLVEPVEREAPAPESWDERKTARYVRVDRSHVDELAEGVGELVALQQRMETLRAAGRLNAAGDALDRMGRLLAGLEAPARGVRLVPVADVFDRFPRLVREAAKSLDRDVELVLEGRDIQLDRAVLDAIADPLMHLLRNAVGHGIEAPDEREAADKPRRGRIVLRARRERSGVVVEVEDDGRGIPVDAIRTRAVETGLVDAKTAEAWSVEELLGVLARPGFSAADRVSELSGRGVGLDAAVERVGSLGGAVELETEAGRGTTFRFRLPVSLATAEAVWVRVGEESYAVPLTHVVEALELEGGTKRKAGPLEVRGNAYRTVDLAETLTVGNARPGAALLVDVGGRKAALVVDGLLGREQVVVRELHAPRGAHPMLSGVTLRGDGRPALVLDPAAVI